MSKIIYFFLLLLSACDFVAVMFVFPEPLQTYLQIVSALGISIIVIWFSWFSKKKKIKSE